MKIYGISQNYEGLFDEFYFTKENAEKALNEYVYSDKEYPLDINEFQIKELEVR